MIKTLAVMLATIVVGVGSGVLVFYTDISYLWRIVAAAAIILGSVLLGARLHADYVRKNPPKPSAH